MNLKQIINNRLQEIYQNDIPKEIKSRIEKELNIISDKKIEYQYLLAYKISKKVKADNRIMIDRICGSSYIAYLLGITFVNPLEYYIEYDKEFDTITFNLEFSNDYFPMIYEYVKEIFKEENIIVNNCEDLKKHNFYLNTFYWCTLLEKFEKQTKTNRHKIDIHDSKLYEYLTDEKTTLLDYHLIEMVKRLKDIDFYVEDIQDLAIVISLGSSTLEDDIDLMRCPRYREDIYRYLVKNGIPTKLAYEIMNFIAKGKRHFHKEQWDSYITIMKEYNITDEYIEMYSKINYLYPKSYSYNRAILYVWLTYYKIHYPKIYNDVES